MTSNGSNAAIVRVATYGFGGDHADSIRRALSADLRLLYVGDLGVPEESRTHVALLRPDVLLVAGPGFSGGDMNGGQALTTALEDVKTLCRVAHGCRILIYGCPHTDEAHDALFTAGVWGILPESADLARVVMAIFAVAQGVVVL